MKDTRSIFTITLVAAILSLCPWSAQAATYAGNGNTGFDGAVGNGTLSLSDDGTNISGTLTVGGSMDDVLVLYIQSGTGGFADTSGFNDQGDSCRQAISGVSASGRSLLTFASGFQPNYAIALAPAAAGTGGLWQLANGGSNSMVYLGTVNLAPLNNSGPYTFNFPAALIGMIPGVRSTFQLFGTYVRADGYRSTEAIAGNLTGVQGWNPFTQTTYANYTFDAGAVLVKLPLGVWAQRPNSPAARDYHTAVWTGSEMIVWGGAVTIYPYYASDGGRYNPVANSWTGLPTSGAPAARMDHTAVWTGSEMIVWGGWDGSTFFDSGGRYNPTANTWTALPATGAPVGRRQHIAVWTGSEMIVWGGSSISNFWPGPITTYYASGGCYTPGANRWTGLPTSGVPAARSSHTAVWTGSEMIVWGGTSNTTYYADGGRYNPTLYSWTALPTNGAPAGRRGHTAVWTGTEMVVWGGTSNTTYYASGGRYNPVGNAWTPLPGTGAPAPRSLHTAAWTGSEMIVWGGTSGSSLLNDGGRYNPAANSWTALPTTGTPTGRDAHTAVWTGREMIVWGGYTGSSYLNDGGRYNPITDSWTTMLVIAPPTKRQLHTAVWTGSEMIVWGGVYDSDGTIYLEDGGRYDPAANTWTALPTAGAPAGRYSHTAVWTGSEMIVWGGYCNISPYELNDGGRYGPAANSWTALPTAGTPAARYGHTALWTGSEMIVWGGVGANYFNDGGRYSPMANSWTVLSTTGAPAARYGHTAVWTGSEMIVWGGYNNGYYYSDGGRYDPSANSWMALPATGAPAARYSHTAVWTGSEMIVWGGGSHNSSFGDGGRYNPAADIWTAIPTNGAPAARYLHTAVWTGSEMIVWGGTGDGGYFNDGGRYNPAANNWTAVPGTTAPDGRWGHTAVWTGSEMIVWGGCNSSAGYFSDTWSYYPYAPAVRISRSGPASAIVAWPVWSSTLRLCQTTNLAAGQWTTVTNAATQVGAENHVTLSPLTGSRFFRAVHP